MNRFLKAYWPLFIPFLFFVSLIALSGNPLLMRKIVVFLCLPAGLVWVLLTFAIFWPRISFLQRGFLTLIWILYTLAGNPILGNRLLHKLEEPYVKYASPTEPFDIVFVLGGGTISSLNGEPQLSSAGDRIVTAARLFNNGKIRKLGASGRSITEIWGDRDLSQETITIWKDFGIPESATVGFSKPRNTREEMLEYKAYLDSLPEKPARIGICTSAWHMKRSEKLWESLGIDAIPVPADFRSRPIPVITTYLIPKKRGFAHVQIALWEYLGIIFG